VYGNEFLTGISLFANHSPTTFYILEGWQELPLLALIYPLCKRLANEHPGRTNSQPLSHQLDHNFSRQNVPGF
jgi:hypothetical protein